MKVIRTEHDLLGKMIRKHCEDAFGTPHVVHVSLQADSCPTCKRPYVLDASGHVDVDATVAQVIEMLRPHHEKAIRSFEKHGVDMKAVKAKLKGMKGKK
jgi:hypothetical protein